MLQVRRALPLILLVRLHVFPSHFKFFLISPNNIAVINQHDYLATQVSCL